MDLKGEKRMVKIDLITGFLGAGKTSFIKKYCRQLLQKEQRLGIIESDYGAINIDLMLLQDLEKDGCDLEMVIGGNSPKDHQRRLRSKLISMAMLGYNRIIVEPSGIYDVDDFFDLLHEEPLDRWYEIGNVITLLDARLDLPLSEASSYMLVSQATAAGAIVLSRTQLASPSELSATLSALSDAMQEFQCSKDISPILFDKDWASLRAKDWEKLLSCGYSFADYRKLPLHEEEDYSSLFFMKESYPQLAPKEDSKPSADTLEKTIKKATEAIFSDHSCGNVIRIKGFFPLPDGDYLQLNASRKDFRLEKAAKGQEVLIVIGEDLKETEIQKHFQVLS